MNGTQLMEELLSYNWNVYKVFKNGKRAKAPLMSFTYDNEETVEQNMNPFSVKTGVQPSSLGISCCILEDTSAIDVEIKFAKYKKKIITAGIPPNQKTDEEWTRQPITKEYSIDPTKKEYEDLSIEDLRDLVRSKILELTNS